MIALDGGIAVLVNSPLSVESGGQAEIYTTAPIARIFETGATTANVLTAGTNITIAATTGNTRIRNALTVGGNVTANAVTSNSSVSAVSGAFSGNVNVIGNVTANYFIGNIDGADIVIIGNLEADYFIGNIDGNTGVFSGNVTANNLSLGNNLSAQTGVFSGNITAATFIGNIQGNIDAGGANTQVQFNDDDVLAGSAGFTFDKSSNAVVVAGNVTAQNFLGNLDGDSATLDSALTVLGTTDLGNIANVTITGGANLQYIQTDGTGNLTYATPGTAANVLYVSKSGNDANDGLSLDTAKLTIAAAVAIATTNTCIFVKSGDYTEANPIVVPTRVSIIGDNLRTVSVRPQTTNQDLFHLNQACYLTGMTFRDHVTPAAAVAFPTAGAGLIVTSPYVQNCSSITTTGCGMRVDGNLASGLKSMVTDSYTQFNQGGIGIEITNQGYAQLVSIFTICCSEGIRCSNGGTCSITNSNSSFGTYGLVADGAGPVLYTGNVISTTRSTATIGNLSVRPAVNDAFIFAGQTQYQLVRSATALVANVSVVTFEETLEATPAPNDGVSFQQISLISASSHTFEYVGTGTNILTATPRLGGIPIQANEVREVGGGRVNYTSTDQFGDFRIGGGLVIKEEAGIIEGVTFDRSLFAVMTPYILALEG